MKKEVMDATPDRQPGGLAPFFSAARPVRRLTAEQNRKIRARALETLVGQRLPGFRWRWSTALAAIALVLSGGAMAAVATQYGLLPWVRIERTPDHPGGGASDRTGTRRSKAVAPAPVVPVGLPREPSLPEGKPVPAPTAAPATTTLPTASAIPAARAPAIKAAPAITAAPTAPAIPAIPAARAPTITAASTAPAIPAEPATPAAPAYGRRAGVSVVTPPTQSLAMADPAGSLAPVASEPGLLARPPQLRQGATVEAPAVRSATAVNEQAMLNEALRRLRQQNDAAGSLYLLDELEANHPRSSMALERSNLQVEALLGLGRDGEALSRLDRMALDDLPRSAERYLLRGELRARFQRWPEARDDFEHALSHGEGTPAWHERALWGRGVARLRAGDRTGGEADLKRYLTAYPRGRHAAEAERLLVPSR